MTTPTPPIHPREADLSAAQHSLEDWLHIVRAEYLEMPGLRLTRSQVQRFWSLDTVTCDSLLQSLTDSQFLRQTMRGVFVRATQDTETETSTGLPSWNSYRARH